MQRRTALRPALRPAAPGSARVRWAAPAAGMPLRLSVLAAACAYLVLGGDAERAAPPAHTLVGAAAPTEAAAPADPSPRLRAAPAVGAAPPRAGGGFSIDAHATARTGDEPALKLALALAAAPPAPGHPPTATALPAAPALDAGAGLDRESALASLDTRLIGARVSASAAVRDAFSARSWVAPPPPAPPPAPAEPPPPPPPPQAPPLPYRYMGRLDDGSTAVTVYLSQGERLIVATPGDVIDGTYRLDALDGRQLRFTYLPLNQEQALVIPATLP